jgi:hypothetical protein
MPFMTGMGQFLSVGWGHQPDRRLASLQASQVYLCREVGAKRRDAQWFRSTGAEKEHFPSRAAMPHLLCSRVEVKGCLFLYFRFCVAVGDNLHANLGRVRKTRILTQFMNALGGRPGNISGFYTVRGRDGALRYDAPRRHVLIEQSADAKLVAAVTSRRWRAHNDMSKTVCFHSFFESNQSRVVHYLGPTPKVLLGQTLVGRQLDRQRRHKPKLSSGVVWGQIENCGEWTV